jgi:hypothetical protein
MTFIPWLFIAAFVISAIMTIRAQMRLQATRDGTVVDYELVERPWLFWTQIRKYLSRMLKFPYAELTGSAEEARLQYLGWRWSMLATFIGLLIVSAVFWR